MKQVKFLAVALAVLMGVSIAFTSCMNGENDPMVRNTTFMKVKSGDGSFTKYVFEAGEKLTFTATNTLIKDFIDAPRGHIALVAWEYDSSLQTVTQNTTNIDVTVLGAQDITSDFVVADVAGGMGDVRSNAAIITLEPNGMQPGYYDKNNLILGVGYYAEKDASKHKFTLVYLKEEKIENVETNTLRLHLRHFSTEDATKENQKALSYCAFDIENALYEYRQENEGKNPTKVVIVVQENTNSNKLPEAGKPGADKEHSLEYKYEK